MGIYFSNKPSGKVFKVFTISSFYFFPFKKSPIS
uniref:Uncharacterized protein n=1 Tax=Podoviridae sp. ct8Lf7 TaxID=2827723 RepID=A0A8S5S1F7_9CAUD|nr:MAG TPA: hypothetical protein [Podoviridae sp. ct8Lf7]